MGLVASHFEDCAVINEWNDARKAQFLAARMRGAALLQLQSLSPVVREDYTDLKRALRARRRERNEKLPDLASSLRRLVGKAYPEAIPDLQDSLAKDQFIDALEGREIRMKIRESGPKMLDEAVSRALQIEAMYEAESRRTKGRSVRVIQEPAQDERSAFAELLKQNTAAINQMVNFVQQRQQQQLPSSSSESERKQNGRGLGPNKRDRIQRRCFRCHKRDHYIADCPQPSRDQRRGSSVGRGNGRDRNVSESNLSTKVGPKVVGNSFSSIHSVSNDTAVYVAGLVAGQRIDMLVDTGSAVTLVHQRVIDRSPKNFKLRVVGEPVVSGNGQPLDVRGKCDLEICVDGVNVVHSVLVAADVTQDCLLGVDFLDKHGCKIDSEVRSLSIGSKIVNLQTKSDGNRVFRISLAETVVLPGRHEIVLHAKVKGAGCGDGLLGLVEPSPSFAKQHDLLLARVVAHPKNNTVPIRLVNPSPTPVTLYKNTSVGTLSELEESSPDSLECNHLTTQHPVVRRSQRCPLNSTLTL